MQGFPPRREGQVTLGNWRVPPFNKWAFHHVREIVPSADIANDPASVWTLPRAPAPLAIDADPDTDGLVILQRGRIVFERYANGMDEHTPHILMSVTKSRGIAELHRAGRGQPGLGRSPKGR